MTAPAGTIPPLFRGLCDDAALFPPGNAPLADAVPAHYAHRRCVHADLLGPFVFPAGRLDALPGVLTGRPGDLALILTLPGGTVTVPGALARARDIDGVRVRAVEIATAPDQTPAELSAGLERLRDVLAGTVVSVEVPRDDRRSDILAVLADTGYGAKFRTGGVTAAAYPGEDELAAAIVSSSRLGVAFKATAGLHHAIRNTDPTTGFEQHGFLNMLLATHLANDGANRDMVAAALADRDDFRVARQLDGLSAGEVSVVRSRFRSFGTCSILEPLTDLQRLGLLPRSILEGAHT